MDSLKTRLGAVCIAALVAAVLTAQGFRERVDVELVRVELLARDGRDEQTGITSYLTFERKLP